MSICYSLYKIDLKESFGLGKIFNTNVFPYSTPFIIDNLFKIPFELSELLEKEIKEGYFEEKLQKKSFLYASAWANRIIDWAKWDRLMLLSDNDAIEYNIDSEVYNKFRISNSYIRFIDYIETGSLYFPKLEL